MDAIFRRLYPIFLATTLGCAAQSSALAAGADIFKRELPDGTVIFSDQPHPDATRVESRDAQVVPSFQAPAAAPPRTSPPEAFRYDHLAITAPADDEVIWNHENIIEVGVDVEPALRPGDRLLILMDGAIVADAGGAGRFTIANVFRGTHVLEAIVEDTGGATMITATPVTFHLRQHSILSPTRPQR